MRDELIATFTAYNQTIWPAQIALVVLALALVFAAVRGGEGSGRVVYAGFALLWAWCGIVFFLTFYARHALVPTVPYVFGVAFVIQAVLFGRAAVIGRDSVTALRANGPGLVGAAMVIYALLVYPLLASALGQHYPGQPTFGAPCPLTIFTFGLLLMAVGRVPGHLLAIPFLWSLAGFFPVLRAGILEDIGLIAAGLIALPMLLVHNRRVASAMSSPPTPGVGETPAPMQGTGRLQ